MKQVKDVYAGRTYTWNLGKIAEDLPHCLFSSPGYENY